MLTIANFTIEETLYESSKSIVFRAKNESGYKIIKLLNSEYPSPVDIGRYKLEFEIASLFDSPHVIKYYTLEKYNNAYYIVIEDFNAISLKEYNSKYPTDIKDFLSIAIKICESIKVIHSKNIIHKDINPKNILINPVTKELKITDFDIASSIPKENKKLQSVDRMEGTINYISPEQTGRMNRALDSRSDLYSLGVTFYEMLTGKLPFYSLDTMEMVYYHITKTPIPPIDKKPQVPRIISDIVMKLLSKNAEERYATIQGLQFDLTQCLNNLTNISEFSFTIGMNDISEKLSIPQKLYGREKELQILVDSFQKACQGSNEVLLINGYSGIGKTSLVKELHNNLTQTKGLFLTGKFDQLKQNTPYLPFIQAFSDAFEYILAEKEENLIRWRKKISEKIGNNASLLLEFFPRLKQILNDIPVIDELSPEEAQNRFYHTFLSLVSVFCSKENPLILFLDDWQWSDSGSQKILHKIVTENYTSHILILCAYRSNEVDEAHSFVRTLTSIQNEIGKQLLTLTIKSLDLQSVVSLVSETLHTSFESCKDLANLLHSKTDGNPFFLNQFLLKLYHDDLISFDSQIGRWKWDMMNILKLEISDNVLDLMLKKIHQLPNHLKSILKAASCIGNEFDLMSLSVITEIKKNDLVGNLLFIISEELITPLSDNYKYLALFDESSSENIVYKFQHDKIQQAAYSLIPDEDRSLYHYQIGKILYFKSSEEERENQVLNITNHWNKGKQYLQQEEKEILIHLNYKSGKIAKDSSVYETAVYYFSICKDLLGTDIWKDNYYELSYNLFKGLGECKYLLGELESSEQYLNKAIQNSRTVEEKIQIHYLNILFYTGQDKMKEAIESGLKALQLCGVNIPYSPSVFSLLLYLYKVNKFRKKYTEDELVKRPVSQNTRNENIIRLVVTITNPAYLLGKDFLYSVATLSGSYYSLRYGHSMASVYAYSTTSVIIAHGLGNIEEGYKLSLFAIKLCDQYGDKEFKGKILFAHSCIIMHWKEHIQKTIPLAIEAMNRSLDAGDFTFACYSAIRIVAQMYTLGVPLPIVLAEAEKYKLVIYRTRFRAMIYNIDLLIQIMKTISGLTPDKFYFNEGNFEEDKMLAVFQKSNYRSGFCIYNIYKCQAYYLYGDYKAAIKYAKEANRDLKSILGLVDVVEFTFYYTLSLISFSESRKLSVIDKVTILRNIRKLKSWAEKSKENYTCKYMLVQAEYYHLKDNTKGAIKYYQNAIQSARENGFLPIEALASEKAGNFYYSQGIPDLAANYLHTAEYLYRQWGAIPKAEHLKEKYSDFLLKEKSVFRTVSNETSSSSLKSTTSQDGTSRISAELDLLTVIKASQSISGEIILEKLIDRVLKICIENAGAEKVLLFLLKDEKLYLRAGMIGNSEHIDTSQSERADIENYSSSIIYYVLRTEQDVILDDTSQERKFQNDEYVANSQLKSILCIPLKNQGKIIAVLYMENNKIAGAFTQKRVELLQTISSQAAIAIENARLYSETIELNQAYKRFVPEQFLDLLGKGKITSIHLGDQVQKEMTIMFCDIRAFTGLSEAMTPQENFNFLNSYLRRVSPMIRNNNRYIDKYIGDAIMALFAKEPEDGLRASIDMQMEIREYNKHRIKSNYDPISIGIGLHTGVLMLGTIGDEDRMEGTVISDAVNLASRVESLSKIYGSSILITDSVFQKITDPDKYYYRVLDRVVVKGKRESVQVIEILNGQPDYKLELFMNTKQYFEMAINAYLMKEFQSAKSMFEKVLENNKGDVAAKLYLKRADYYMEHGVPIDWEGVEVMDHK